MFERVDSAESVRQVIEAASQGLVERQNLVELVVLSAVARSHLLVIGPPGTAKSQAVRRVGRALGGDFFEYLLGRFTEPSEIFGPVDLRKLRDGVVETQTKGMLPEAEIAFLDEVFQGSTAILNTLLGLLNERVFRRGHTRIECPLRVCVGAANHLPADESLAAFADRFLVHVFVEPVGPTRLEELLAEGWRLDGQTTEPLASMSQIDTLAEAARDVAMQAVQPRLADAVRQLRQAGVELSDRRIVRAQRLVAAACVLDGRDEPDERDLWPLVYAISAHDQQQLARDVLRDVLEPSQNEALGAAAEDASLGPAARADRLARTARSLLEGAPDSPGRDWFLELEAVAREIDASFTPEQVPEDLSGVREAVIERLESRREDADVSTELEAEV